MFGYRPIGAGEQSADADPAAAGEQDRLDAWRLERFLELGFPVAVAERLTREQADWHRLSALLDAGCPLRLAKRIA